MSLKAHTDGRQFVKRGPYLKAMPVIFQNLKINVFNFFDQLHLTNIGIIYVMGRWDLSQAISLVPVVPPVVFQISSIFKGSVEGNRLLLLPALNCSAIVDNKPIIL